jgi:hypothetical protein
MLKAKTMNMVMPSFMDEVFAGLSWELVDQAQEDDSLEVI